jgi:phosphoribosylformylglycinamidine cyclo-ligase
VERSQIIDGSAIRPGDVVLGLASSGAHSNGYSLVRKILERAAPELQARFDGERTLAEVIMAPTRIYVKPLLAVLRGQPGAIKGLAHITGGGLLENVPRILGEDLTAVLDRRSWPRPRLFDWLQDQGGVAEAEMHRVFNCGIGMVVVVAPEHVDAVMTQLTLDETVYRIGRIDRRAAGQASTVVV